MMKCQDILEKFKIYHSFIEDKQYYDIIIDYGNGQKYVINHTKQIDKVDLIVNECKHIIFKHCLTHLEDRIDTKMLMNMTNLVCQDLMEQMMKEMSNVIAKSIDDDIVKSLVHEMKKPVIEDIKCNSIDYNLNNKILKAAFTIEPIEAAKFIKISL